ncbi:MAG: GGDEF domain-containing protein [Proteobacteria bacterium]|nr:GGDEF domain-containing protein [Pseudomonadota bacterium]
MHTGSLTETYNRPFFDRELERTIQTAQHFPEIAFSILAIDLNGLKQVNDRFGHSSGDEMIVKVAELLKSVCRKSDIVARLGGDEFVILCPATDRNAANDLLKRIWDEEQESHIVCTLPDGTTETVPVRFSIGLADSMEVPPDEAMKKADQRMYEDKRSFYATSERYR